MLVLKKKVTRAEDGSQVFIEVVNATGIYDAESNPGGFGDQNPARNTLALLFYGNFKLTAGDQEAVPLIYDPATVESFTLDITRAVNGHLNFSVFAVPKYNAGAEPYADGSIVWDDTNPSAPIVKKRTGGVWVTIDIEDLLVESTVVQTEGNNFVIPAAEAYQNELNATRLSYLRAYQKGEFQEDKYTPARNDYDYVNSLLVNAVNKFCSGAYGEAQILLEEILSFEDERKAA